MAVAKSREKTQRCLGGKYIVRPSTQLGFLVLKLLALSTTIPLLGLLNICIMPWNNRPSEPLGNAPLELVFRATIPSMQASRGQAVIDSSAGAAISLLPEDPLPTTNDMAYSAAVS